MGLKTTLFQYLELGYKEDAMLPVKNGQVVIAQPEAKP